MSYHEGPARRRQKLPTSLMHDVAHGSIVALVVTGLLMLTKALGLW